MLSVVLPTRNEDMCAFTVRRLFESRQGCALDVIVIEDGSPKQYDFMEPPAGCRLRFERLPINIGLCYCRDMGIAMADYDAVLVLDAHSNFYDTDRWAWKLAAYSQANPTHLGCAVSVQLRPESMDMDHDPTRDDKPPGRYRGAGLIMCGVDSNQRHSVFPSKWGLPTKWGVEDGEARHMAGEVVEVQTVLGGAYILSKSWYMDGLRRPWRDLRGWGTSEQSISIPNWLLGGTNVLMPVEIGHMYRTAQYHLVPYRTRYADIYWNQWRLAHALPIPERLRGQLLAHIQKNETWIHAPQTIAIQMREFPPGPYQDYLACAPRTWAEYVERWKVELP